MRVDCSLSLSCLRARRKGRGGDADADDDADGDGDDIASMVSILSRATPSAMNPRPVRVQARNVRSLARWSRATLPVLAIGFGLRSLSHCIMSWCSGSSAATALLGVDRRATEGYGDI